VFNFLFLKWLLMGIYNLFLGVLKRDIGCLGCMLLKQLNISMPHFFFILGYLKVKTEKKKNYSLNIYKHVLIVLEMFHCFKWTF